MALCPTNHTLTQGSLHYRLATLGYQKRKAMGFINSVNFLCALPPFEMAIKSRRRWGSSSSLILQKDSAGASPLLGEGLGVRL